MARAQAQYLRIYDYVTTYQRWQNFYVNSSVIWNGASWDWLPFDCDGMVDGAGVDESDLQISLPATPAVVDRVEAALRAGRFVEVGTFEFDILDTGATLAPLADQTLLARYVGELVEASGTFETITIRVGSSLSPVGVQVPPRALTSRLIGVPCKLGG